MRRRILTLLTIAAVGAAGFGLVAGAKRATPEQVALEYGRALYAMDADAIWRLLAEADRRVKDEATFRRQQRELQGFTREVLDQLAGFISATPVETAVDGDRARVVLRFQLPDANASELRALMHDWDEDRLNALAASERVRIREHLARLGRERRLPVIEGDQTIELVREDGRWRVFLDWAGGARVRFETAVDPSVPLRVTIIPDAAVLAPGERLRVVLRATNSGDREVITRVGHRIAPEAQAKHLALLQCPLLVPVTLKPGETEEFTSEYLLLADVPADARRFVVTYRFPAP